MCRLLKSLYGLKQAPRVSYELFNGFLSSHGFSECDSDSNVYVKRAHNIIFLIGLYIDDLILISNSLDYLSAIKALFTQCFSMTDNSDIEFILGSQVRRDISHKPLTLLQNKYIVNLLTKFNLASAHPFATSLEAGIRYSKHQSDELTSDKQLMQNIPYKQAIGSLQYLVTCIRWNLAFPINHLAQFLANPCPDTLAWSQAHFLLSTRNILVRVNFPLSWH